MIDIYYANTDILANLNSYILDGQLSSQVNLKLSGLKREKDRSLVKLSLFLLLKALGDNGFGNFKLSNLQYTKTGRPFFDDSPFDFNISHSDNYAAVAFSSQCHLGIDIEIIKEINFSDFTDFFTLDQWNDIYSAENKYKKFYYYWTLIESAVKADGRGLPLLSSKSIKLVNSNLYIDNTRWYYNHYDFENIVMCCLTTDKMIKSCELKNITSL